MNGGQVALTGFTCQVLAAVLDGLSNEAWISVAIEPTSETDEYEKVDIRWVNTSGTVRHVQVKHSRRLFSRQRVEEWARELKASLSAQEYHLVLFGAAASTLDGIRDLEGVVIRLCSLDDELIWDACSFRLSRLLEVLGQELPTDKLRQIAERVTGQLLLDSRSGRVWTNSEIRSFIWGLAKGLRKAGSGPTTILQVSMRRTIVVHNPDLAEEYVRYVIQNQGATSVTLNPVHFSWVQQDTCKLISISDGFEGPPPDENWDFGYSEDRSTFGIGLRVRRDLEPGEQILVGVKVQRTPAVQRVEDLWIYNDPLLPSNEPIPSEVVLIFPVAGSLQARDTTWKSPRVAVWHTVMRPTLTQISATFNPVSQGIAQNEASVAAHANQYLTAAATDLDTRLPVASTAG